MKIIIIGGGRVGTSFGYLLNKNGFEILGVCNKHFSSAEEAVKKIGQGKPLTLEEVKNKCKEADLIIITTPDDLIEKIAKIISEMRGDQPDYLMHMSGLYSSDILKKKGNKVSVFSLHPLQAVPNFCEGIKLLPEAVFTLEGDERGKQVGRKISDKLGLNYNMIKKEHKAIYHAAAVVASNYLVTLVDTSYNLLEAADVLNDDTKKGILNLVKGTLNNLEKMDTDKALTGPIARGDINTVQKHINSIKEHKSEYSKIYKILGEYTAEIISEQELFKELFSN